MNTSMWRLFNGVVIISLASCGPEKLSNRLKHNSGDGDETASLDLTEEQAKDLKARYMRSQTEVKSLAILLRSIDTICDRVEQYNADVKVALASVSGESKAVMDKIANLKVALSGVVQKIKESNAAIAKEQAAIQVIEVKIADVPEKDVVNSYLAQIRVAVLAINKDRKDIKTIEGKMLMLPPLNEYAALLEQREALEADIVKQQKVKADLLEQLKVARKLSAAEVTELKAEIVSHERQIQGIRQTRFTFVLERFKLNRAISAANAELLTLKGQDGGIGSPFELPTQCSFDDDAPTDSPSPSK